MYTPLSLTAREQVFTQQFAAHGNAVVAAETAGYPAAQALTVEQTLLDQPHIKQQLHALALSHGPDDISMVLVDYKGGAAFAPFAGLRGTTTYAGFETGHIQYVSARLVKTASS